MCFRGEVIQVLNGVLLEIRIDLSLRRDGPGPHCCIAGQVDRLVSAER